MCECVSMSVNGVYVCVCACVVDDYVEEANQIECTPDLKISTGIHLLKIEKKTL